MSSPQLATHLLPPLLGLDAVPHRSVQSPEGMLWLQTFYESQFARDWGTCNPVMRSAALAGMLEVQRFQALHRVRTHVVELRAQLPGLLQQRDPVHLARLCEMMDTAISLLANVWEPERTAFMEQLLPIQKQLRRLAERLPSEA